MLTSFFKMNFVCFCSVTESWFSFRVDNFVLQLVDVGEILKIKIRHDNLGFMPAWDLAKVMQKGKCWY